MIREAKITDLDKILELGQKAHEHSPYKELSCDSEHIRRLALLAITMPHFCAFLAEEQDQVIGMVVGGVNQNAFGMLTASDLITYTAKPGPGAHLYSRFVQWARKTPAVLITVSNSFENEKFDIFLSNIGLKRVGGLFIGEIS